MAISLYPVDWPFAIFKVLTGEHLTLAAQQNYFVRIFPTRGLAAPRVGLELVDEATGREAVQGAALAQGLGDVPLTAPQ